MNQESQINQKTLKNNHNSWKVVQLMCLQLVRICLEHSASYCICGFAFQVISRKTRCSKDLIRSLTGIYIRK